MATSPKRQLYMDVATFANAPLSERIFCADGRGGVKKIPRRYHLLPEELITLKKDMAEKNKFISPYGTGRLYTFILDSLVALGAGKAHPVSAVFAKFEQLASHESTKDKNGHTLWHRFANKAPRNPKTGRDPLAKFLQNIEVLQRLGGDHPYAFKLAQVGACIDIYVDAARQIKIQLRTGIPHGDPVKPVNLNRKRQYTKTVDEVRSGIIIAVEASQGLEGDDESDEGEISPEQGEGL